MNVGHPSNMARIVDLYGGVMDEKGIVVKQPDLDAMKHDMFAISINDEETRNTIKMVYDRYNVLLEPHGAVGWAGLCHYFNHFPADHDSSKVAVCLETAHPAKFPREIERILGVDPEIPASLFGLEEKEERFERIDNKYKEFKKYLENKF
jgi:threonine synthase